MPSLYWCNCSLFPSYKCPLPLSTNQNIIWTSAWMNDSKLVILWSQINFCWPFLLKVLFIFRLARGAVRCSKKQDSLSQILKPSYKCLPIVSVWVLQEAEAKMEVSIRDLLRGNTYEGLKEKGTRVGGESLRQQGSSDICEGRKGRQEASLGNLGQVDGESRTMLA